MGFLRNHCCVAMVVAMVMVTWSAAVLVKGNQCDEFCGRATVEAADRAACESIFCDSYNLDAFLHSLTRRRAPGPHRRAAPLRSALRLQRY